VAPEPDLRRLASLLDDEDESVAVNAMAELLLREDELGTLPGELQEHPDPLMRRRAHQLQAALTYRRRRREFAAMLRAPEVAFVPGLIALHMQWYDNDSMPAIAERVAVFLHSLSNRSVFSLEDIAYQMHRAELAAECETTLRPENYCIGTILANRSGSAAILSGLGRELAASPEDFRIVRALGDFAVYDGERLLIGARDWRIVPAPGVRDLEFWEPRSILALAADLLFGSAVNSDSFRYVLTLAQAMSGEEDDYPLNFLPYPYRPCAEADCGDAAEQDPPPPEGDAGEEEEGEDER